MTANELMNEIVKEADKQTDFYKEISIVAETKNKLKCIEMLIAYFDCDFDSARIVIDHVIDGTPLPSTLSKEQQIYNNAVAQDWQNKPKCPTCNSMNIKKISTTAKIAGTITFGFFSKTARSQFCCKNCGYKW